ncbi:hypothetical protein KIL84_022793 [Mauremys mutica]|uniref:Uncharacterized protein n=1 Tax=Mauremys mutica TaxID=74926 RepID=A0A9D3WLR0_9SAUR|nr:hypothetical protein KIL84_022793 [Mauremys mutica]
MDECPSAPERVASPSSPSGHSRDLSPAHPPSPPLGLSLTSQCGAETALKTGDGMYLTGSKSLASSSVSISPISICLSHGPEVGSHIPASQHPFSPLLGLNPLILKGSIDLPNQVS